MTRLYIQPSWINSAEDHDMWSGGNDQYRGDRSVDVSTFDKNGRARMEAFSDQAIDALKEKRKTSIPLVDRILPQMKRVNTLTDQLIELESEYKSGNMSINQYSLLRNVLITKRDRAIELYNRAISLSKVSTTSHTDSSSEAQEVSEENVCENVASVLGEGHWLSSISDRNIFKNMLVKGCVGWGKAVEFKHKAATYLNTLKAL